MREFKEFMKSYVPEDVTPKKISQFKHWEDKFDMQVSRGRPILYYRDERYLKDVNPILGEVHQIYKYHAVIKYKVYEPNGHFRGYLYTSVNYCSLICGDEKVVFF